MNISRWIGGGAVAAILAFGLIGCGGEPGNSGHEQVGHTAQATTVSYSGLENAFCATGGEPTADTSVRSGIWCGSCSTNDCAGGNNTSIAVNRGTGLGTQFINYGSPNGWADELAWIKFGAQDWATHINWDFWVYFPSGSIANAAAAEFDIFQFIGSAHVYDMMGLQCNFESGYWDNWNSGQRHWYDDYSFPCSRGDFSENEWHHLTIDVNRDPSTQWYHYNYVTLDGNYMAMGANGRDWEAPGTLPSGWGSTLGVQMQLDTAGTSAGIQEYLSSATVEFD